MKHTYIEKPRDHKCIMMRTVITPLFRWNGKESPEMWRERAQMKLWEDLGLNEIEPYACDPDTDIEFDKTDEENGFREIRFRFMSENNVSVPCHLLIPINAEGPRPVVVCLQGHSNGMHVSLGRAKCEEDEEDIKGGDRDFAIRAVKEGCCAVAIEQRACGEQGCGGCGNDCHEAALRALLLGRTLVGERVWDVLKLIDVLETEFTEFIDKEKIICLGNSGGGTATIYASALDDRIKISVPSCAIAGYGYSIGSMDHCECNYIPGVARDFDMGEICAMVAPRKLLVVSGEKDPIFPIDSAKICVEEASRIFEATGVRENLSHVIGNEGHRFYADASWPLIHKYLE